MPNIKHKGYVGACDISSSTRHPYSMNMSRFQTSQPEVLVQKIHNLRREQHLDWITRHEHREPDIRLLPNDHGRHADICHPVTSISELYAQVRCKRSSARIMIGGSRNSRSEMLHAPVSPIEI